jgi:hypothetical protein
MIFDLVLIFLNRWKIRPRVVLSLGVDIMPIELIERLLLKVCAL